MREFDGSWLSGGSLDRQEELHAKKLLTKACWASRRPKHTSWHGAMQAAQLGGTGRAAAEGCWQVRHRTCCGDRPSSSPSNSSSSSSCFDTFSDFSATPTRSARAAFGVERRRGASLRIVGLWRPTLRTMLRAVLCLGQLSRTGADEPAGPSSACSEPAGCCGLPRTDKASGTSR